MSKRMSTLWRIMTNLKDSVFVAKQKDIFVGTDQFGNKYFEKPADKKHNLRSSRYIQDRKNLGHYEIPEVPVEWNAWLRGRRKDPPTPEEIERNHIQMLMTQMRARELEAKYGTTETPDQVDAGVQHIAEDIKSNPTKSPFPVYDEFEISPGEKVEKPSKKQES